MGKQFQDLRASELFCPLCRRLQPVRERLLLVLPGADIHEYRCVACASSLGTREVRQRPAGVVGR
jgi:hypothetical protein